MAPPVPSAEFGAWRKETIYLHSDRKTAEHKQAKLQEQLAKEETNDEPQQPQR